MLWILTLINSVIRCLNCFLWQLYYNDLGFNSDSKIEYLNAINGHEFDINGNWFPWRGDKESFDEHYNINQE